MTIISYDNYDFFNKDDHFSQYKKIKSLLVYGKKREGSELSIVIPVYKRTEFIRDALDSAISQKTKHIYNIIIVDNTVENDSIYEIIRSYSDNRILYYRNEKNIGMTGNWNRCIELADTKWITMLHDDDKLVPDYVETVLNFVSCFPTCSGLGGINDHINSSGDLISNKRHENGKITRLSVLDFYFNICPVSVTGLLFNRETAIKIGGFDNDFYPGADANFICKLCIYGAPLFRISKVLLHYRIAANESLNPNTLRQYIVYNHLQIESLREYIPKFYQFFYKTHQNMFISDAIKMKEIFHTEFTYEDIKKKFNYNKNIFTVLYSVFIKIARPFLYERLINKFYYILDKHKRRT